MSESKNELERIRTAERRELIINFDYKEGNYHGTASLISYAGEEITYYIVVKLHDEVIHETNYYFEEHFNEMEQELIDYLGRWIDDHEMRVVDNDQD